MESPLVTVVCLCYNHEKFVKECIESVLAQSYKNVQIIVVDDASTDNSVSRIKTIVDKNPSIQFLPLPKNLGNCSAFNQSLPLIRGEFVIDLATDDVLLPDRIKKQVDLFRKLDHTYGVVFTDAVYINEKGDPIRKHYENLFLKGLIRQIPQGDIYAEVLSTYFIAAPTMMSRKSVFDSLGGYDEALSYEDFDFWVRSSRNFKYAFLNEITTKIRISTRSLSRSQYQRGDGQLYSTWLICRKAVTLNRTEEDRQSLDKRLKFEIRQAVFSQNYAEAELFYNLLQETGKAGMMYKMLIALNKLHLPLRSVRKFYHQMRYGK